MTDQANVDELLAKHAADIVALRAAVPELPPVNALETGTDWDDIWLLRWVLSYPDVEARVEALKKAIVYRTERKAFLANAAAGGPDPCPGVQRLQVADFHGTTEYGEPVFMVRTGCSNPTAVMDAFDEKQVLDLELHRREIAFRKCDAETRSRRVIVKMVQCRRIAHASLIGLSGFIHSLLLRAHRSL